MCTRNSRLLLGCELHTPRQLWVGALGQNATNEALWRVLHTIERSILPRTIDLRTSSGQLQIEASASRLLVGPRINGGFYFDDELKRDAPDAWDILRSGANAVASRGQTLASARTALLKLSARALVQITSADGGINYSVKALRPMERSTDGSQLPSFSAFELAVAMAPALQNAAQGRVAAFYRQVAPKLEDVWLFDHAGRPAGYPDSVTQFSEIEDMAKSVASALTWREHLSGVVGPVMSVFIDSPRETVRCLAVDTGYVVLASGSGLEMSVMISAWRTVQQGAGAT